MARLASLCFNCKQCERECPSEVDIPHLVLEAKAARVAAEGLRWPDWALSRTYAAGPIGLLLVGPAIDGWGVSTAALVFASAVLAVAAIGLLQRSLRELDGLHEPGEPEATHVAVPTPHPNH